ncbi:carbohydrate esterase family 9 protein [Obba rivulosa]|uniref:Carbohydrate esterase family 9 protein n=1 Tax=Obba rivulosa TaxID=1052685 RepID=A0A8E2AVJ1_9APHY|nr:carbohydrate esterase family 9 protein [Obba rivulosa]
MSGVLPGPKGSPAKHPAARRLWHVLVLAVLSFVAVQTLLVWESTKLSRTEAPLHATEILDKCRLLDVKPGPPPDFNLRKESDRFVPGTRPTLIRNATIWTGRVDGLEVLKGDILLDKGLIKEVGPIEGSLLESLDDLVTLDAEGAWVSPGIVDLHSHLGVTSNPNFAGASDGNSHHGPILPWLRALDSLNTHSEGYRLSVSGGVTTALVLPGSANAIGGQGIVIKLRAPEDRSPTGMLLENPYSINGSEYDPSLSFRWRQMKHACGENPDRVYSNTRMDTTWAFRQAYDKARQIKEAQDDYCVKAKAGEWAGLGKFPEDLQWEALVDVLRGRVKVQTHCYETVDLDDLVRITNEFKFSIAAFHHAHETYLVPDTLKAAYGHPPAAALFAVHARYKRESYRGSEFAPKILAENGLQVVMKSDHPVLDSRFLLWEAQQAHYYGLPHNLALAAVTTTPAKVMGQDHRIGIVRQGYDADIVLWDSHPLALGATPKQVWIDGIAQLERPHSHVKASEAQHVPKVPNFGNEADKTLEFDGLPPLEAEHVEGRSVVFTNVSSVILRDREGLHETFSTSSHEGVVVAKNGAISCYGTMSSCSSFVEDAKERVVDLQGGAIMPGLTSFGAPLGLEEIGAERSTSDGFVYDPLVQTVPKIVGAEGAIIRAVDGLQFGTRDALLSHRSGVTTAITAPKSVGFLSGMGTAFSTGAAHKLEKGAVVQPVTAFHVSMHHSGLASISTKVAALRHLLFSPPYGTIEYWLSKVRKGNIPLVIDVDSADAMTSLIELKREVESRFLRPIKMTFTGGAEAHILAKEISEAGISVVLYPSRPFPSTWEQRRILPGPPLTETNAIETLLAHGITVGIGVRTADLARNARFDAAWAALETGGKLSRSDALALVSVNLEKALGVQTDRLQSDLVATRGGDLLEFSKVVGIISPRRGVVDLF